MNWPKTAQMVKRVEKINSANEKNMWHIYTGVREKVFKDDFESQLTS